MGAFGLSARSEYVNAWVEEVIVYSTVVRLSVSGNDLVAECCGPHESDRAVHFMAMPLHVPSIEEITVPHYSRLGRDAGSGRRTLTTNKFLFVLSILYYRLLFKLFVEALQHGISSYPDVY